jgi:hypothetical protein
MGWQLSVLELCVDSSETSYPSVTAAENNHKGLSLVRLGAMKILPQIAQDTGST